MWLAVGYLLGLQSTYLGAADAPFSILIKFHIFRGRGINSKQVAKTTKFH